VVAGLLERFRRPQAISAVSPNPDRDFLSLATTLVSLDILRRCEDVPNTPPLLLDRPATGAFCAPHWDHGASGTRHLVILGASSDAGTLPGFTRGVHQGPNVVRDASQYLGMKEQLDSGACRGWYDADFDEWLLKGNFIFDAGNLVDRPAIGRAEYGSALAGHLARFRAAGGSVLLLGGDHSLTLYAIESFGERPLGVVHVDAHSDLGPKRFASDLHHGNVFSWISERPNVRHVLQLGIRGMQPNRQTTDACEYVGLSVRQLRSLRHADLGGLCRRELDYYVSVDIDALDPSVAPDTPAPVADGFSLNELRGLLRAVLADIAVVGADLMEVLPSDCEPSLTGRAAAELALELLAALGNHDRGNSV
jgi:agmatinase